jgi:hypothetical protein
MSRFWIKRQWTCLLALSLLCALSVASVTPVRADGNNGVDSGMGDISDQGNPLGAGDPDSPEPAGSAGRAAGKPVNAKPLVLTAGDGLASDSVMMWRVRAYLMSLRIYLIRY